MIRFLAWVDRHAGWIVVLALLMAAALVLSGCGDRSQLQVISDTRAGAQAYQKAKTPDQRAKIADGVMAGTLAATDHMDLLSPTWTPDQILADPAPFLAAANASAADPPPYVAPQIDPPGPSPADILRGIGAKALHWGAWAALAGIVALLLRFVPWLSIGAIFAWGPLSTVAGLAASIGSFATVVGSAAMWLADWLWLVVLIAVAAAVIVALFHWPQIRRAWAKARAHITKP
jgi:hypothetical protein